MDYRVIIREIVILLVVTISIAFSVNYMSSEGIPLFGEWESPRGALSAKPPDNLTGYDLEINDALSAKNIFDNGRSVFVDARPKELYDEGHIKGSVSLPVHEIDAFADTFFETYPSSTPIVAYCSGRGCYDSFDLAKCLMDMGYSDVRVFIDGYSEWEKRGYPVEKKV